MGMPRNPNNKRHVISLRLTPDLLDALDAECRSRLIGRNLLVEHLIREGLTHLPAVTCGQPATEAAESGSSAETP